MRHYTGKKITMRLNAESIDEASEFTALTFKEFEMSTSDIYRCRLFVEEVLGIWKKGLGEQAECRLSSGMRLGRPYLRISVPGARINPKEINDDLYSEIMEDSGLLYSLGLSTTYIYAGGCNEMTLSPPPMSDSLLRPVGLAIGTSLVIGIGLHTADLEFSSRLSEHAVTPLFSTMMNLLSTIAGPLIFLSVCSGIYSIGNLAMVGRMAKKLLGRLSAMTFLPLIILLLLMGWMFPFAGFDVSGQMGTGVSQIYQMILNIIPTDIVTPFQSGNAMQIIFLACACGVGILVLGRKASALAEIVGQIHSVVQLLMETIGNLVPFFVFVSVLNLLLPDSDMDFSILGKQIALSLLSMVLLTGYYVVRICIKWQIAPMKLMKKFLPTFLIAVTTASSSAAYATNAETCEKSFGISRKMVDFGVPVGQVIYMPAGAIAFLLSSLCMGEVYGIVMTPVWIVTALLVSGILAIATPPIPGGALSCYTVLFMQLGIPAEGVALAVSIDMVMDFVLTAANLLYLQGEMLFAAENLDMLDADILKQ